MGHGPEQPRLCDTAFLEDAVTAFRNALLEHTRERTPQQWAMARGNLGNALVSLGVRESDSTHLEEAVTAFRDALLECARESVPLQWAAIQNNLEPISKYLVAVDRL